MFSLLMSTTKMAPGNLVISVIEPKFFSSFDRILFTCNLSFLDSVSKVPSFFIRSMDPIFFTAFRIVTKLVNIPPGHLSVIYGILIFLEYFATISLACFFVATKRIFLPDNAIFFSAF